MFPLYGVRQHERLFDEQGFKCVETYYNRYVIDDPRLPGTYPQRRMRLIANAKNLPYKVYPLKHMFTTLSQLLASNYKYFIDDTGAIKKFTKSKMYNIQYKKIVSSTQIFNGKYQCIAQGISTPFILPVPAEYIAVVLYQNSYMLYGYYDSLPEVKRQRVKI